MQTIVGEGYKSTERNLLPCSIQHEKQHCIKLKGNIVLISNKVLQNFAL